jgi:hypothetical protein
MANLIQLRRDNSIAWTNANPVLKQGEPGFETDTSKLKIGDGVKTWTQLDYYQTSELPANAEGYLANDGDGNIAWVVIPERFSGDYADLTNKPMFSSVAFSGNYTQLNNKPVIPADLSQLTDTTNILSNVTKFNSIADSLFEFDFGTIGTINVNTRIEWLLNSIDVDNGTINSPANLNHDAGTLI